MLRDETIRRVIQFRDDREWRQFTPQGPGHLPVPGGGGAAGDIQWAARTWNAGTSWAASGRSWRMC